MFAKFVVLAGNIICIAYEKMLNFLVICCVGKTCERLEVHVT